MGRLGWRGAVAFSLCLGCVSPRSGPNLADLKRDISTAGKASIGCSVMVAELEGFQEISVLVEERGGEKIDGATSPEIFWVRAYDMEVALGFLVVRHRVSDDADAFHCLRVFPGHEPVVTDDGFIVSTYRRDKETVCISVESVEVDARRARRTLCERDP